MFLGEVLSDFRFFWWPLASCILLSCLLGFALFGNKFLLIQKNIIIRQLILFSNCDGLGVGDKEV